MVGDPGAAASALARRHQAALAQPLRLPAHLPQLPERPVRHGHAGRGRQVRAGDEQDALVPALWQPTAPNSVPAVRSHSQGVDGRVLGVHGAPLLGHHLPPGRHVHHGSQGGQAGRRRPRAARARHQGAEGDRRLHHAAARQRKHQRANHHGGREGRRPHQEGVEQIVIGAGRLFFASKD